MPPSTSASGCGVRARWTICFWSRTCLKLDLLIGSDDGCQVWLNAKRIQEDRGTHPLTPGSLKCEALPLQRGWNHFIVKVVQGGGEWQFRADLRSSDPQFLTELRTSLTGPNP